MLAPAARCVCLLLAVGALAQLRPAGAQTLDRILAVVAGHVITASDVRAFLELGLVEVAGEEGDAERRVVDYLIDRRLVLDEVDRWLVGSPTPPRIEAELDALAARFSEPAAFADLLARVGLSHDDLRQILRDEARRESFLRNRFGGPEVAEGDLRTYYDEHADDLREEGHGESFEEARDAVGRRLAALRDASIEEWVAALDRRAPIARFDR